MREIDWESLKDFICLEQVEERIGGKRTYICDLLKDMEEMGYPIIVRGKKRLVRYQDAVECFAKKGKIINGKLHSNF